MKTLLIGLFVALCFSTQAQVNTLQYDKLKTIAAADSFAKWHPWSTEETETDYFEYNDSLYLSLYNLLANPNWATESPVPFIKDTLHMEVLSSPDSALHIITWFENTGGTFLSNRTVVFSTFKNRIYPFVTIPKLDTILEVEEFNTEDEFYGVSWYRIYKVNAPVGR